MPGSARCGWPGCRAQVSWRRAWCYRHWKAVPEDERSERVRTVFNARRGEVDL